MGVDGEDRTGACKLGESAMRYTQFICDFCKKTQAEKGQTENMGSVSLNGHGIANRQYDICASCMNKLCVAMADLGLRQTEAPAGACQTEEKQ